jgi:hypothetical protein
MAAKKNTTPSKRRRAKRTAVKRGDLPPLNFPSLKIDKEALAAEVKERRALSQELDRFMIDEARGFPSRKAQKPCRS